LIKSPIGRIEKHKLCVKGLGFRKIHQTVTLEDTPSVRGMVNKIRDMVEIVEG
jgi:large subunit ribosomal protein L30